jgi:hypothetical protein
LSYEKLDIADSKKSVRASKKNARQFAFCFVEAAFCLAAV